MNQQQSGYNILIVDDTIANLRVLTDILKAENYTVRKATSGQMALRAIKNKLPDLILLDIQMSDMDGYEVCQKLKADDDTRDLPVIFVSALSEAFDKVKAFQVGGVDYITKPFQFEEVLARVKNQLMIRKTQQELEQSLLKLRRTQAELIQKEKMSSLGEIVAGMAHEINNPITFIAGNIGYAREYVGQLLDLLDLYEREFTHPTAVIKDKIEEIDLKYLRDDLEHMFVSMKNGSDRIRNIILSLRNFSRLDEAERKGVDIHDGLENSLLLLEHRLPKGGDVPEIAIVKNYGNLPSVNCYANQLNQVFLHMLTNAIDILTTSQTDGHPEIHITTEMLDEQTARIRIADNGAGMSESVRKKIFDPFFTTKPVGQGTGLGLSVSYQIVTELHKGQLQCYSQPGQGSEFTIDIPI